MSSEGRGQLFVVSAPSGTGKTTLVERLVQSVPNLMLSRSFTSRAPRAGEQDGVDYNFISRGRFETMKDAGEFLECADVFGNYYGTSATATEAALAGGRDLVLVIDVQGARQVRARASAAVGIFVLPPSRCSRTGCGDGARTRTSRSAVASPSHAAKSTPSPTMTMSSSTTRSSPLSSG